MKTPDGTSKFGVITGIMQPTIDRPNGWVRVRHAGDPFDTTYDPHGIGAEWVDDETGG